MKYINNLKINSKKLALLLGLSTSLVLTSGCASSKTDEPITDIMIDSRNTTYFDDLMDFDQVKEVEDLEEYIELSKIINRMKFDRTDITNLDTTNLLEVRALRALINNCKDNKNKEDLDKLNIQEQLLNQYIYESYDLMADTTLTLTKSKILEMGNLDIDSIDQIKLPRKDSLDKDPEHKYYKINGYNIKKNSSLGNLIDDIYKMQSKGDVSSDKDFVAGYNKDRNKIIMKAISDVKEVIPEQYDIQVKVKKR